MIGHELQPIAPQPRSTSVARFAGCCCVLFLASILVRPSWAQQKHTDIPADATVGHGLSPEEASAGWISLFDGETLFGWNAESDANWRVESGTIVVDTGSTPGLLRTTSQFDDYEIQLEYQCDPQTNSGVFLRTSPQPTDPQRDCFELNIAPPENPFPTGSLVGRLRTETATPNDDQWHQLSAKVAGNKITVSIDGQRTAQMSQVLPTGRGYIGLQFNEGSVRFRNIRLKPIAVEPILTAETLGQWTSRPAGDYFQVSQDDTIHIRGGLAALESPQQFADFLATARFRTNQAEVNSGLFFRCIPGEELNGYEVQIDHTVEGGDASRPANGGTGAIFRRSTARRVIPVTGEWFVMAMVCTGPRIAVWVNGHQVTDWVDHREPHPNPRRGFRANPGTIMLQAHDEKTDLHLDHVSARELHPRVKRE